MPPPSPQVETGQRTRHRRCPPRLPRSFFLHNFAPPPPSFARGPVKGGRVACPSSFDSTLSSLLSSSSSSSWALPYYVVAIATSLDAPLPLSLCRRLYRHAAATIPTPTHYILRISRASGWLLHRHLSCRASASLVVPVSLSLRHRLSCGALPAPAGCRFTNYLDMLPSLLPHRLVVFLLPLSLRRSLSLHYLSHCTAISLGHRPTQLQ
jgi:hypothetical protein